MATVQKRGDSYRVTQSFQGSINNEPAQKRAGYFRSKMSNSRKRV